LALVPVRSHFGSSLPPLGADPCKCNREVLQMPSRGRARCADIAGVANNLWMSLLDSETSKARAGRLALVPVSLGLAAALLICAVTIGRDVHVRFWAGNYVLLSLPLTMAALATCFLFLVSARVIHYLRINHHADDHTNEKGRTCEPTIARIRTYLLMMLCFAVASVVMSSVAIGAGIRADAVLTSSCGTSGPSQELQLVYDELASFRDQNCNTSAPVHECDSFSETFLPARPYMTYLEQIEHLDECGGFCKQGAALFAQNVSKEARSCAEVLSERVRSISLGVGVPCLILGTMLAAWCMAVFAFPGI